MSHAMPYTVHEGEFVSVPGRSLPIATPESSRIGSPSLVTSLPKLLHKWHQPHSVLSVAAAPSRKLLFCGTQDSRILVYDTVTFQLKCELLVENASILCLDISDDEQLLFSAGSDSLVKVWDIDSLEVRYIIYSLADIGDIFSIKWCGQSSTIYIGAQNASLLWTQLPLGKIGAAGCHSMVDKLPNYRYDKFFDSKGPGGSFNVLQSKQFLQRKNSSGKKCPALVEVDHQIRFAHNGYIYCMEFHDNKLITCGGDGLVNVWDPKTMKRVTSLENNESILSMSISGSYLYVGLSDSTINVWDLSTQQQIRKMSFESEEVSSLAVYEDSLFKGSSEGLVMLSTNSYSPAATVLNLSNHNSVLTVEIFHDDSRTYLVSGGSTTCLWDITLMTRVPVQFQEGLTNDHMLKSLEFMVSCKTVSKFPELYLEESRKCARYLSKLLARLGAYQTKLLPVANGNPIVHSCFKASADVKDPPRVIWYGHYDVVDVANDWETDPYEMVSKDGCIYGRGISDNKGPVLAAIYAVAELASEGKLECDVVFLIEGEEESGSIGFQEVITKNKDNIGPIDWVMLSNSYWLDDEIPCLNYGLRGIINASVTVKSLKPDRHSGVDGGVSREPTMDLIQVLSQLVDPSTQKINIPEFYDSILPLTDKEMQLYTKIEQSGIVDQKLDTLFAKWRNPSLTVHNIQVSGPNNNTVIPQSATAMVSIRIVPSQELEEIKRNFEALLCKQFDALKSENSFSVDIYYTAEPWLGDPFNHVYQVLGEKIELHWGTKPLFIREGGSIPSIRFLEKCFGAPAAQIPCGQSSDNAHLKNEKLRLINLFKLRSILKDTFSELKRNP
ncbi:hypothetical protein DIURU_005012 [Diutina rugosa]|uniref:Peptidase M20 dimerisation domain-containing protein n=1 Tax=Diutina rugosa TaxID=5481 RepID=A0A642UI57_DIURU|nr:uncharacterized protein DIURU_005012 [Diutina rugosa]KAA8898157.1 hypothetical protein DIURU_005012 [Diutina rugosa]